MIELYKRLGFYKNIKIHIFFRSTVELILKIYSVMGGIEMDSHPHIRTAIDMILGRYEKEFCDLLQDYLKEGDIAVDVGANIGYMSLQLSKYVGDTGRVLSFEPNPTVFPILKRNTRKKKNIECFELGLSEQDGCLELSVANGSTATGSFISEYPVQSLFDHSKAWVEKHFVNLVKGSSFLQKVDVTKIDFLKIDVEGWEINVLRGLECVIRSSPDIVLFIELNLLAQITAGYKDDELLKCLIKMGFKIFYMNNAHVLEEVNEFSFSKLISSLGDKGYTTLLCRKNIATRQNKIEY